MFKNNKIKKKIFFSIIILTFSFFVVSMPSFANDKNVGKIGEEKIDNNISCNTEYLKLLEAVKIKADVANEKENAYNKAINELKSHVYFFGVLLLFTVIIFGFYRDKKIVDAKKEIMNDIESKKKNLEEKNTIDIDRKMLNLDKYKLSMEKNQNIAMQKIKDEIERNIDDIQDRLKKLESGNENIKNSSELLKDAENKNENPYD